MYINNLKIKNFRNYENQEIDFDKNINIIYGNNGQGKTNLLEAIYICSIGKSYRTSREKEVIKFGEQFTNIELNVEKEDRKRNIKVNISENNKNIILNNIKVKKFSEILGNLNIVMFTPDDIDIIKLGPTKRRKFLDIMISQLRPNYVNCLNLYKNTLEQRNEYLKQINNKKINDNMIEIWDEKLAEYGEKIYNYRNEFINKIKEKINNIQGKISEEKEFIEIEYTSDCFDKKEYIKKLQFSKDRDIIRGYTSKGIHRDDFTIYINKKELETYGSQGQQRSVVLSLKLCELEIIYEEIGEYPVLLLDDFMSELDENRRTKFIENIEKAQVIITCTDKIKIKNAKYFNIENGKVK